MYRTLSTIQFPISGTVEFMHHKYISYSIHPYFPVDPKLGHMNQLNGGPLIGPNENILIYLPMDPKLGLGNCILSYGPWIGP